MCSLAYDARYVQPLAAIENQFLQVLVDRFRIKRKGNRLELHVAFDDNSPAIWLRAAKRHILTALPLDKRNALQQRLDDFFASGDETFDYCDPEFPFRLGNGGTLPVVRLDGRDYYCLFYRDSHPTGWNIANGGANNRHDLLHPDAIIERELREELIVVDPGAGHWYVFDWHNARLHDHPDFAMANQLWAQRFQRQGFAKFEQMTLPLKWSVPPDADVELFDDRHCDAMRVRCGTDPAVFTGQGFLNINAEDFGIEFDRIAKLSVGADAVFCDGELHGRELLNRVVGLFATQSVHQASAAGRRRFVPDRMFWNGEDLSDEPVEDVISRFLAARGSSWSNVESNAAQRGRPDVLDLCPVTRAIIGRHAKMKADAPSTGGGETKGPYDVFISFASEDRELAKRIFDRVADHCGLRAFFSDVTVQQGNFADQIDAALDSCWAFIGVGSRGEHFHKSWVKYEWQTFHNDIRGGRKPESSPYFAFLQGMHRHDLPRPFHPQQCIVADSSDLEAALARLPAYLVKPL